MNREQFGLYLMIAAGVAALLGVVNLVKRGRSVNTAAACFGFAALLLLLRAQADLWVMIVVGLAFFVLLVKDYMSRIPNQEESPK